MNICFDHQIFAKKKLGGISRYFCELANNLSLDRDNHVEIFAPLHKNLYLEQSLLAKGILVGNSLAHQYSSVHLTLPSGSPSCRGKRTSIFSMKPIIQS